MVQMTIAELDKGPCSKKYLFEMVGLFPGDAEAVPTREGVLAKTLWKL
jgi:hypothetical protein